MLYTIIENEDDLKMEIRAVDSIKLTYKPSAVTALVNEYAGSVIPQYRAPI